jgi:hypothetical protein
MKKPKAAKVTKSIEDHRSDFFAQFQKQDDRSAVILAAALVDLFLGELLYRALLPPPTAKDDLLGERSPLGSLYAKNIACFRLGLIDKDIFDAINIIRDIRNIYAHRLEYSDLSAEPYSSKIREGYVLFSWYEPFIGAAKEVFGTEVTSSVQFRLIAVLVALRLKQAIDEQTSLASTTPKTLISVKWEVVRMGQELRERSNNSFKPKPLRGSA